jgi:hypothetical protein
LAFWPKSAHRVVSLLQSVHAAAATRFQPPPPRLAPPATLPLPYRAATTPPLHFPPTAPHFVAFSSRNGRAIEGVPSVDDPAPPRSIVSPPEPIKGTMSLTAPRRARIPTHLPLSSLKSSCHRATSPAVVPPRRWPKSATPPPKSTAGEHPRRPLPLSPLPHRAPVLHSGCAPNVGEGPAHATSMVHQGPVDCRSATGPQTRVPGPRDSPLKNVIEPPQK